MLGREINPVFALFHLTIVMIYFAAYGFDYSISRRLEAHESCNWLFFQALCGAFLGLALLILAYRPIPAATIDICPLWNQCFLIDLLWSQTQKALGTEVAPWLEFHVSMAKRLRQWTTSLRFVMATTMVIFPLQLWHLVSSIWKTLASILLLLAF